WAPGLEIQRQIDEFAKKVEKMSNGRLVINSLPGGWIVGGLQVFDAVEDGVLDAAYSAAFYWVGNQPVSPFFAAVPAGVTVLAHIMWLYHGPGHEYWKEAYADYNFGWVGAAGVRPLEILRWSHQRLDCLDAAERLEVRALRNYRQR